VSAALIQQNTGATDGTSVTVTLATGTTTGRVIIIVPNEQGGISSPPRASGGGGTAVVVADGSTGGTGASLCYATIIELYNVANGTTAFTITASNGAPYGLSAVVTEWSGLAASTASCFDANATNAAAVGAGTSTPGAGSVTPNAANDLFISTFVADHNAVASVSSGPTNSFTALTVANASSTTARGAAYFVATDSSAHSTAWGLNKTTPWAASTAAFLIATVPGAPTIGTAAEVSATSASLNWTPPANAGGEPITNYYINVHDVTASTDSYVTVGNITSTTLTGLTTAHAYTFRVAAINSVVTGAYSSMSNSVTLNFMAGASLNVSFTASTSPIVVDNAGATLTAKFIASISTSSGFAPDNMVPWTLPCAINDHAYMMDFEKTRITTMQVRRQSADDSVEPGEQSLSAAGVWPRAQDNYFLGAGQEFLDNRFAFESVYVHSGEYPSVRTRFWKSQGVNPWHEGKLSLLPEYASIATSTANLIIVVCGSYLYKTDGVHLYWTLNPVGVASPAWTLVTSANTHNIVSLTSDGSRVWFACGSDGVYVTVAGTTTSANAATPAALNGIGGLLAYPAGAGNVNATNLPNGSTTWYVSEVDAFGEETAAASVTATVASLPINLTWNPDTNASSFNVYRGTGTLVYSGDVPSFVDDGTVAGKAQAHPTTNGTGVTAYAATFIMYAKGHLIASTGRDLVEILSSGNITFIYQHENPNFVWTCGTEVPSAIIVAGNAGHLSFVGAIQPDSATNGATLAPPTWATSLPEGETINAIAYNAGSILLGTSLGVRTGTDANNTGIFNINPVIEAPGPVLCTAPWSQYQYFGWSNYNPVEDWAPNRPTLGGIGRADLSQYTTPGVPAYATDVMGVSAGTTTQVIVINAVPYFVVLNAGTYTLYGPDGKLVASGWLEPGWVRYGTLENKILVEVDFQHEPLPAGSSVNYEITSEDLVLLTNIGTYPSNNLAGSTTVKDPLSAGLMVGDRFLPLITLASTPDQSAGPVFLSHITKAMVTTKRQDEILLALIWTEDVRTLGPSDKRWYQDCFNEYLYLKGLEGTGQVVNLTMGSEVRTAFIDQVMLEPNLEMTSQRTWFMGTVTVKLVSLS
jgi:hypothetical protein